MEYMEYGDLTQYCNGTGTGTGRCSAMTAKDITGQLLDGLATLHERMIAHRNIKPQVRTLHPILLYHSVLTMIQNVLVASPNPIWVKIADFGVSKRVRDDVLLTRIGTQGYMAPELMGLLPRRYQSDGYIAAVDMWSLGCLVHELLTGQIPFLKIQDKENGTSEVDSEPDFIGQQTDLSKLYDFCNGEVEFPTDILRQCLVSDTAIEFLKAILVAIPESRATAKGALGNAWLVQEEEPEREET